MSVNVETRDKARTFTEKLYKIMEVMDNVVNLIPEADYINVVDTLKELYTDDRGIVIQTAPETREAFMEAITNNIRRDPSSQQRHEGHRDPSVISRLFLTTHANLRMVGRSALNAIGLLKI